MAKRLNDTLAARRRTAERTRDALARALERGADIVGRAARGALREFLQRRGSAAEFGAELGEIEARRVSVMVCDPDNGRASASKAARSSTRARVRRDKRAPFFEAKRQNSAAARQYAQPRRASRRQGVASRPSNASVNASPTAIAAALADRCARTRVALC